jgi:hypothetical protein
VVVRQYVEQPRVTGAASGGPAGIKRPSGRRSGKLARRAAGKALARQRSRQGNGLHANAAERALRGIALGRKSWLFAGSDRGGQRASVMYSLIVTAKLNDVDPIHQNRIAMGLKDYTFLAYRVVVPLRCPAQQVVLRPAASRNGWCVAAPLHRTGSLRRHNRSSGDFRKNKPGLD